jgi:hypothetical protein
MGLVVGGVVLRVRRGRFVFDWEFVGVGVGMEMGEGG